MFLRTKCDKELYFSLHTPAELAKHGLPVPVSARPGIGALQRGGREFEKGQNTKLLDAFGTAAVCLRNSAGDVQTGALQTLLTSSNVLPRIVLQGKFEPRTFQTFALGNLGLDGPAIAATPPLEGLIPDLIVVRAAEAGDEEILVNGARAPIDTANDTRTALSIIDIKNVGEGNPSYASEVAFYACMLANWLAFNQLTHQFFVTSRVFLWTRSQEEISTFDALLVDANQTPTTAQLLGALLEDCEDANFRFYMPAVLRFLREDVPRVIQIGDANWRNLDWHVAGKCTSCDWLGYDRWANAEDKARIAAQPTHYCLSCARQSGHLSRIAGISSGARRTLNLHAITDTAAVAATTGTEPPYKEHSLLKRERLALPERARALQNGQLTRDASAVLASLAPFSRLFICATVNFDAGAGLLTGLSVRGRIAPINGVKAAPLKGRAFLVEKRSGEQEWIALEGFLTQIADYIDTAGKFLINNGQTGDLQGQIAFWDQRQFEELCAAMGRHLPRVLGLSDRKAKSLAWLFPPEQLLEKESGAISPCVTFIEPIIRRTIFAPTPHVITLFDTVEQYHFGNFAPTVTDVYYREFLADGIPRERIAEIWSGAEQIKRGGIVLPRTTVISEFIVALEKQSAALDSIAIQIRVDFAGQLRGASPKIDTSIPRGSPSIAFDGKLWIWWDRLEHATSRAEGYQRLAQNGNALESSYEAIHLLQRLATFPNGNLLYSVSPESTEAKLDDGDSYLAVGLMAEPGFPLEKLKNRVSPTAPPFVSDPIALGKPVYAALSASLVHFDRAQLRAEIAFRTAPGLLPYLAAHAGLPLNQDIFLTEGLSSYDWADYSRAILLEIGNPPIAVPDPNAAASMALPAGSAGTSPITPAAEVLWTAGTVQARQVLPSVQASAIAAYAAGLAQLNHDQIHAVEHAVSRGLTVIWGPPGTGKTKTLAASIHALAHDATQQGVPLKILISGPTYKAVEELVGRLVGSLNGDPQTPCKVFMAYGGSRAIVPLQAVASHFTANAFNIVSGSPEWAACESSISDPTEITIVATHAQQAYKFGQGGNRVSPVFDVVVLDESSQIPVTKALSPLARLKSNGRLIVAGDHLQMPPIASLDAPVGSEYLVGSILTYLRERPFAQPVHSCDLCQNYRSAKVLVDYALTLGYPPGLQAVYPDSKIELIAHLPTPGAGYPASLPYSPAWNDVLDPAKVALTLLHDDDLSSQSNLYEARMIAGLVYSLRVAASAEIEGQGSVQHRAPTAEEFWGRSVGIVTPHRAQRALVVRELKTLFPSDAPDLVDAAVDTVEKFQGGERHVILVSFGVADGDVIAGEETFLMQLERTNVAISRAMAKCIVVMPTSLAGHIPQDKRALKTAHAIKGYVDEFCDRVEDIFIQAGAVTRKGKLRWAS